MDDYERNGLGNNTARVAYIAQLEAIVMHQCGDHSKCVHKKWCSYLKIKNTNPTWTES